MPVILIRTFGSVHPSPRRSKAADLLVVPHIGWDIEVDGHRWEVAGVLVSGAWVAVELRMEALANLKQAEAEGWEAVGT